MESIHIAVTDSLSARCHDLIQNVHPRIKLVDISAWVSHDHAGGQTHSTKLAEAISHCEIIYGHIMPPEVTKRAPALKWIQSTWTGVDIFLDPAIVNSRVIVTNMTGIHEIPIAESVLAFMLMFAKKASFCFDLKQERQWKRFAPGTLDGQSLGIIGLGGVGREVARLAKAFRMKVIAMRRTVSDSPRADNVDELLDASRLHQLLQQSDYVALTLPYTSETAGLIGADELRVMKPTACLINISRGNIVDESALESALEAGWIAGAGLDVFSTEPLPEDSKLWRLPEVIFSPHVTGEVEDYDLRATYVFCDNLRRYIKGLKLHNRVDKQSGY